MPKIYKVCVQCEHDFYISEKDQDFFSSRELEFPKRCWSCRQKNRKERAEEAAAANQPERRRDRVPPPVQQQNPNGGLVEFFTTSEDRTDEPKPSVRRGKRRHRGGERS
jgi:hypothetical protein